jgi:L-lactate dehydrogenase (cytochrome)
VLDKSAALTPPPPTVTRAPPTVPPALRRYLCLDDFEATAQRRIPRFLYGYIAGGAETDAALRDNRKAFDEYGFVPRVLNDVSGRDCSARPTPRRSAFRRWALRRFAPIAATSC